MVKKLKESRTNGIISIPNVGSSKSECISLTYTIRENLLSLENIRKVIEDMDKLHNEEPKITVTVSNFGDSTVEDFVLKYQVKSCGSESKARQIKDKLDEYVSKQGGQTTLDEAEY